MDTPIRGGQGVSGCNGKKEFFFQSFLFLICSRSSDHQADWEGGGAKGLSGPSIKKVTFSSPEMFGH